MTRAIVLNSRDNVATLIDPGVAGTSVDLQGKGSGAIKLNSDIPYGHKCAIETIAAGREVRKYGQVIGLATVDIALGEHVHVDNLESLRGRGDRQQGR